MVEEIGNWYEVVYTDNTLTDETIVCNSLADAREKFEMIISATPGAIAHAILFNVDDVNGNHTYKIIREWDLFDDTDYVLHIKKTSLEEKPL